MSDQMHEIIFTENSVKLGCIHWFLLKSAGEMLARRFPKGGDEGLVPLSDIEPSDFAKEVGKDEIFWWVSKKESSIDELRRQTENVLVSAQKLKEASRGLITNPPNLYGELLSTLKRFTDDYKDEINRLYDYVTWLFNKDSLGPCILYTYRVWGSTRRSDRWMDIRADTIEAEDPKKLRELTEIVFGLRRGNIYTVDVVRREIEHEIYEGVSPEDALHNRSIKISSSQVATRTSYEVLHEFATYFELIRNSLRNILVDIEKFEYQRKLISSDAFWRKFVNKAITSGKVETQIWDFKQTIKMWWLKRGKEKEKDEAKVEFAEDVASFANAAGGVLVVGVSDTPRKVVGIGGNLVEIERRLKYTRKVIEEHVEYEQDFFRLHQVAIKDESGDEKICLVIVIAQSSTPVSVKDQRGRFTYPIRRETGVDRVDLLELQKRKRHIKRNNYDFINDLNQFIYEE